MKVKDKIRNKEPEGIELVGQECKVLHRLEDGYWLMEFKMLVYVHKMKQYLPLRWYIHKDDLD